MSVLRRPFHVLQSEPLENHEQRRGEIWIRHRQPEGIAKRRRPKFPNHCGFSFLSSFLSAFSASFTSSSVSFPDSIRCDITGCVRPPNSASKSSISRRCADCRDTTASKICALLIFLTRRTAFLPSRRYTVVWTVVYEGLSPSGNDSWISRMESVPRSHSACMI